jgi:four helix bundle protein
MIMAIQTFRDVHAWKLGMDYVLAIYALTEKFPPSERFGLTSQLRRAAAAIPSNISEGHLQGSRTYLRYVVIAIGSVAECETQVEIARRLNYANTMELSRVEDLVGDLRRVLFGLRRSLRAQSGNRRADI